MTEKQYAPTKTEKKVSKKKKETLPQEVKTPLQNPVKEKNQETQENKIVNEDKKEEKQKTIIKKTLIKKTEVFVMGSGIPMSTKESVFICKFIKNKTISKAIEDLEQVVKLKKAVPMKGEIPHRKGKGMMSGRFPQRAAKNFIVLLKSLRGNANNHEIENPVIVETIANLGSRSYGKFGRWKRKKTNIKIVAKSKKETKNKIKKQNKKLKKNKEKKSGKK